MTAEVATLTGTTVVSANSTEVASYAKALMAPDMASFKAAMQDLPIVGVVSDALSSLSSAISGAVSTSIVAAPQTPTASPDMSAGRPV